MQVQTTHNAAMQAIITPKSATKLYTSEMWKILKSKGEIKDADWYSERIVLIV